MKSNFRFVCLIAVMATAVSSQASVTRRGTIASSGRSLEILQRVLNGNDRIAYDAIVTQKSSCSSASICQFKVIQDTNGRRLMIAVQPLSIQGLLSYDDGHQWSNFYPDENRLVVLPSPRIEKDSVDARMKLASQNYRFAMETDMRIAGRTARVVVAIPRSAGMPVRKFMVDSDSDVVLRVESIDRNGDSDLLLDTKSIRFLPNTASVKFTANGNGIRVYRPEIPVALNSLESSEKVVRFQPIRLKALPCGFATRSISALRDGSRRYVAQRLTDGIVTATLYQFPSSESPFGPSTDGLDFAYEGVTLRLVGDVPYVARRIFIEQAARSLGRTFRPTREQFAPVPVFPNKKFPELEARIEKAMKDFEQQTNEFLKQMRETSVRSTTID